MAISYPPALSLRLRCALPVGCVQRTDRIQRDTGGRPGPDVPLVGASDVECVRSEARLPSCVREAFLCSVRLR